jgi:ferric-dicitrate binding protein FerR (iron transport regulator)
MLKRPLLIGAALLGLTAASGCTPQEIAAWTDWNNQDPAAAQAFAATPEVQADFATLEHEQQAIRAAAPTGGGSVWDRVAQCESGGNWAINTGNGYSGGLQFLHSSWRAYGGSGQAWQHSRSEQIAVAERILNDVGWKAWPACSRKLGLR